MKLITFAGQKGGTGKTTLATNVAGMLAAEQRRVTLVDADPQQSAQAWVNLRPVALPKLSGFAISGIPEAIRDACSPPDDARPEFLILDTGGRISAGVREAVRLADFVVLPVTPYLQDVRSTQAFYREVLAPIARTRELRGTVVINNMRRGVTLCRDAEAYLRNQTNLPVMASVVHQYVAFAYAYGCGMTVCEAEPHSQAALDMRAVFAALKEELLRG